MPVLTEQDLQPTLPLNHARIGYDDAPGAYTATSAASGSPAVAAKSWQTFERWRPTASPATLTKLFDTTQRVDYIGIGAGTLSVCDSVKFELLLDGEWREVELTKGLGDNPTLSLDFAEQEFGIWEPIPDNEAVMILLTPRNGCGGVRVTVEFSGEAPSVGKLAAGEVLTMLRPFYQGHSPALLAADVTRTPSTSQGGEWLGTTIIRQGRSTQMQWANLGAGWVRRNLRGLIEHAVRLPFFVAWNPLQFRDCLYAASEGAPQNPTNSGPRDLQSWSLDVKAYSDGSEPVTTPLVGREYDEIVTHTRASVGTYFDETSTLRTAAIDEPRFTYDPVTGESLGLLVEGVGENKITWSEDFTDSDWSATNVLIDPNASESPDASITSDKLIPTTTSSGFHVIGNSQQSVVSGNAYTASVYAKAGEYENAALRAGSPLSSKSAVISLVTGEVISNTFTSIRVKQANGFYRISVTETAAKTSAGQFVIRFGVGNPNGSLSSFAGDGTSGLFMWGAQLEEAPTATSYIKTTGTPAIRAPDVVSVGDVGKWLNRGGGVTVIIDVKNLRKVDTFPRVFSFDDGTADERLILSDGNSLLDGPFSLRPFIATVGGTALPPGITIPQGFSGKMAVSLGNGLLQFAANGGYTSIATSLTAPAATIARIFNSRAGTQRAGGVCGSLKVLHYPSTQAEIVEIAKSGGEGI